ncbi:acetyl-CoA acetyltransferase [Mycobacterium sp. URHB0021]
MTTRQAVVCEPVRTPIGRYGGVLKSLTAVDLGVAALKGLVDRTGIDPGAVQVGARSGVKVHDGLARGRTTAGGLHYPVPGGMLEAAENLHREYGISRQEQDELAVSSHQRAVAAQKDGILAEEIIPVTVRTRQGEELIDTDEHPRADTSVETLAKLKPVLVDDDPEATVTTGNASGQNDAASMCIVTTQEKADELALTPFAKLVSWGSAGVAPNVMGIGPVPATEVALAQGGVAAGGYRPYRTQ